MQMHRTVASLTAAASRWLAYCTGRECKIAENRHLIPRYPRKHEVVAHLKRGFSCITDTVLGLENAWLEIRLASIQGYRG